MSCRICRNLLPSRALCNSNEDFHLDELLSSAQSCQLCSILLSTLQGDELEKIGKISIQDLLTGGYTMFVRFKDGMRTRAIYFYNLDKLNPSQRNGLLLTPEPFSQYTGSDAAFAWALSQFKICLATHKICSNQTVVKLPARVLTLGDLDTVSLDLTADVHLHESSDELSRYACLSHCWGGHQPIMLTTENLIHFRDNIPWSALPKSFQDAIAFARRLRIPYIWIDSLCILQDDKQDWREQSAQMARIYENSIITLAASAAKNSEVGCFFHPNATTMGYVTDGINLHLLKDKIGVQRFLSDTHGQQASSPTFDHPRVLVKERPWHPALQISSEEDRAFMPLFGRGWAYQERMLAPRLLHFGPQELFWECNEYASCECGKLGPSKRRSGRSPKLAHQQALQAPSTSALIRRWRDIVKEYTSRELTSELDKLPAIAGIAKQLMGRMETPKYLAGLWGQSLIADMMWKIDSPRVCTNERRAPSWSWVTAAGTVSYPYNDESAQAQSDPASVQIFESSCTSHGSDDFVDCASGYIILRGYLAAVRLQKFVTKERNMERNKERNNFGISDSSEANFYSIFPDALPVSDDGWKSKEPVWPIPPPNWKKSDPHDGRAPANNDIAVLEYQYSELRSFQDNFVSCLERQTKVWCLLLSMWNGRTGFLVLDCVDAASQTFKRLGIGWHLSMRLSLFDMNGDRQTIRLI